jgi:uncharacterized protein
LPLLLSQLVDAGGSDNGPKSIEFEIFRQYVDVPAGMYRHRLRIVWHVWISGANSISDPHFGWKLRAFFDNNDFNILSDAIVITDIADKQTVGRCIARPDGEIFGIPRFKSRHVDCSRVAARQVCYEKPAGIVRIVDVVQPVWNFSGYRQAARFINFLLKQTYRCRFAPLASKRRDALKDEEREKKRDNLHQLQFNRKTFDNGDRGGHMSDIAKAGRILSLLLIGGITLTAGRDVSAQQPSAQPTTPQSTPEGYIPRGTRPAKGLAPGMKVTDLGKGARTYRVNMTKGDEIMSGLTDFAEKYHIRNGHFTAVGAINKGLFGWSEGEGGRGQRRIELNQEAEIVSLMGSITVDNQGRSNVHGHGSVALSDGSVRGGHWWEAHVSIVADVWVTEEEGAPEPAK